MKAWMKLALSLARRKSPARAMLMPAPAATPLMAVMTGFSMVRIASTSAL